jgi:hypothetical protein
MGKWQALNLKNNIENFWHYPAMIGFHFLLLFQFRNPFRNQFNNLDKKIRLKHRPYSVLAKTFHICLVHHTTHIA